jgi:hypothetical protein
MKHAGFSGISNVLPRIVVFQGGYIRTTQSGTILYPRTLIAII